MDSIFIGLLSLGLNLSKERKFFLDSVLIISLKTEHIVRANLNIPFGFIAHE